MTVSVLGATLSASAEEEGAVVEAEGCSQGEEGESCPPVPGMCSQLASKDVPGASTHIWLCSMHPDPLLSFMVLF